MERRILALLLILFLFSGISGVFAIKQIEPYSRTIEDGDFVGKTVPESTLELVFSKENEKYDSLKLNSNLPSGFSVAVKEELESFKVLINVPKSAVNSQYKIGLKFSNTSNVLVQENVDFYFSVEDELLFASMNNFSQETLTNNPAQYGFTLINNSDAEATFIISSSLPTSWYSSHAVVVKPKSIEKHTLEILPGVSGERKFNFNVSYAGKQKTFDVSLKAEPTLESKFSSVLNGLPFYSFSLIPSYLLNGLFSLFF
jgi:hypothetical protein